MQPQLIDNINQTLRDDLISVIKSGSRVSIAVATRYVYMDLEVIRDYLNGLRYICRGKSETHMEHCRKFDGENRDGLRISTCSQLFGDAIASLIKTKETTDLFSFLEGDADALFGNKVRGLNDFELITFLIIR